MYEFQCNKCKRKFEHYLMMHHPCDHCGGKLRYLYNPVKANIYPSVDPSAPLSREFIPVRCFGGFGDIWYYRRKPRKRLKRLKT